MITRSLVRTPAGRGQPRRSEGRLAAGPGQRQARHQLRWSATALRKASSASRRLERSRSGMFISGSEVIAGMSQARAMALPATRRASATRWVGGTHPHALGLGPRQEEGDLLLDAAQVIGDAHPLRCRLVCSPPSNHVGELAVAGVRREGLSEELPLPLAFTAASRQPPDPNDTTAATAAAITVARASEFTARSAWDRRGEPLARAIRGALATRLPGKGVPRPAG